MGLQIQNKAGNLNVANILYTLSDPSSQNFTRNDNERKWRNKQMLKFRHKSTFIAGQLREAKNIILEDEHVALLCQGLDLVETKGIPFRAFWGIKASIVNRLNQKTADDNTNLSKSAPKKPFLSNLMIQDMFINNALVPEAKEAIIEHLSTNNTLLTDQDRLDAEREQASPFIWDMGDDIDMDPDPAITDNGVENITPVEKDTSPISDTPAVDKDTPPGNE
jgi:hypothetical protein